jgi:hypothetical protein
LAPSREGRQYVVELLIVAPLADARRRGPNVRAESDQSCRSTTVDHRVVLPATQPRVPVAVAVRRETYPAK